MYYRIITDELQHSAKGSERKDHKYIDRSMGKNGKWVYVYPDSKKSDLTPGMKKSFELRALNNQLGLQKETFMGKPVVRDLTSKQYKEIANDSQDRANVISKYDVGDTKYYRNADGYKAIFKKQASEYRKQAEDAKRQQNSHDARDQRANEKLPIGLKASIAKNNAKHEINVVKAKMGLNDSKTARVNKGKRFIDRLLNKPTSGTLKKKR